MILLRGEARTRPRRSTPVKATSVTLCGLETALEILVHFRRDRVGVTWQLGINLYT